MTPTCRLVLAIFACLVGSSTVVAQERLELLATVGDRVRLIEIDATVSGFGRVLNSTTMPSPATRQTDIVVVHGARYLAWLAINPVTNLNDLVLFDRRTRRANLVATTNRSTLRLLSDPRRPRLFGLDWRFNGPGAGFSYVTWILDGSGERTVASLSVPATTVLWDIAYAPDSDELFALLDGPAYPTSRIVAIRLADGALTADFTIPFAGFKLVVHPSGQRVWATNVLGGFGGFDVPSGADAGFVNMNLKGFDSSRNALIATLNPVDEFLTLIDAASMTETFRTRIDFVPPGSLYRTKAVVEGRWMTAAYVTRAELRRDGVCNALSVEAHGNGGGLMGAVDVIASMGGGGIGCSMVPTLVRSPLAPTALAASVGAGNVVQLGWSPTDHAIDYEVEYGVAPGQRAGAIRVGQTTSVTIPGVPPGVYYVRIKAFNDVGGSPPSNEVRVVVP